MLFWGGRRILNFYVEKWKKLMLLELEYGIIWQRIIKCYPLIIL